MSPTDRFRFPLLHVVQTESGTSLCGAPSLAGWDEKDWTAVPQHVADGIMPCSVCIELFLSQFRIAVASPGELRRVR
jgi:hypothetical protein